MAKKLKAVYFCDPLGDRELERDHIEMLLEHHEIEHDPVEIAEADPMYGDQHFDVLFFDWGGMIIGCSGMIESLLREIISHATEHPSRLYVMASRFTKEAMEDALIEFGKERPANIFLSLEDAIPYLKEN